MYIPGLSLTACKPSKTVMELALYSFFMSSASFVSKVLFVMLRILGYMILLVMFTSGVKIGMVIIIMRRLFRNLSILKDPCKESIEC